METNKISNPLLIFGITIILLIANSYVPEGLEVLGLEIKQVDFLGDIRTDDFYEEYIQNNNDEYDEDENYDDFIRRQTTVQFGECY